MIIGFFVAQLLSINCLVLIKYTSDITGEVNIKGNACNDDRIGKFSVFNVYVPGFIISANFPPLTKAAF